MRYDYGGSGHLLERIVSMSCCWLGVRAYKGVGVLDCGYHGGAAASLTTIDLVR